MSTKVENKIQEEKPKFDNLIFDHNQEKVEDRVGFTTEEVNEKIKQVINDVVDEYSHEVDPVHVAEGFAKELTRKELAIGFAMKALGN